MNNIISTDDHINLKKILYKAIINSSGIVYSLVILLTAYWLQDVVFFGTFSKFTSDVPNFVKNLSSSSVMAVILPYIIAETLFYINNIIVSYTIPKIELEVVEEITKQTLKSLQTTKKTINTNEYVMNLKKVIESKSVYYLFVSNIVPTFLISIGLIYYFMLSSTKTGIIILLLMIIFACLAYHLFTHSVNASHENEDAINIYYDNIQDVVSNYDLVITSNSIQKELDNLNKDKQSVYDTYLTSETTSSESSFSLRLLSLGMIVLLDSIAVYLYSNNQMRIENVTSICITSVIFLKYFNTLVARFRNTVGYIGKFCEVNNYFSSFKINNQAANKNLVVLNGDIDFSQINLKYGDKQVLNNFSFKINGKTKVCLLGDMGSGKTSLLKMMCGLIDYDGKIMIDGQNLKECNHDSVINKIAYIQQHPKMFNKDILYNISYGTNTTEHQVLQYIKYMNLEGFFKLFPQGLKTLVGKEGVKLSGGQKQLIAIIRALLQNKPIILLDEPTSSLDLQTKTTIINLLKSIKDKTIIVVTHDQSILDIFDDFIKMEQQK